MTMMDIGHGWILTRPGMRDEDERVAMWYIAPERKDCIAQAVKHADDPKAEWQRLRRMGYRCERAHVAAVVHAQ